MSRNGVVVEVLGVFGVRRAHRRPEADGTAEWDSTGVVVVEPVAAGRTGLGWSYADPAGAGLIASTLAEDVIGREVDDVPGTTEALRRRCLGRPGLAATAISAIDLALWDLKADRPAGHLRRRERTLAERPSRSSGRPVLPGGGGLRTGQWESCSEHRDERPGKPAARWHRFPGGVRWRHQRA